MSMYDSHVVFTEFSCLRKKSNVSRSQNLTFLVPLKHGISRSAFVRKTEQLMYLVKIVAHCHVS